MKPTALSERFSQRDAIRLVHPRPCTQESEAVFRYLLGRAGPMEIALVERMRQEAPIWEELLSAQGSTPEVWRGVLARMKALALVRNLRNCLEVGLSLQELLPHTVRVDVRDLFPHQVCRAYQEAPSALPLLDRLFCRMVEARPPMEGTPVLLDVSGSMCGAPLEQAAPLAVALALKGGVIMADVVRALRLQQGPYDWVYYIALGTPVAEEVRQGLGGLPRTRIQQAGVGEVPTLGAYTFKPAALQLGNLLQTPEARVEVALEAQGQPRSLRLSLDDANLQKQGAFLEVVPNRLEAGNRTLTFRLRGQKLQEGEYTAWLCLEAVEGTLVRPEAIPLRFAYHPPAAYALTPENVPEQLDLRPGESATLQYRLEGNAWAKESLSLNIEAPKGLEATLNGQKGPVGLKPGEGLEVRLTNRGLTPGQSAQPSFQAQLPSGSQLSPLPSLPSVTQPKTLWERLLDYWWLLLPLSLLAAFLLARWLAAQRPWGQGRYFGPPPECAEKALNLKGRADLGQVDPNLKGVKVYPRGEEVVLELPSSLEAKCENNRQRKMSLESGDTFSRGTRIYFYDGQREIASFKVES